MRGGLLRRDADEDGVDQNLRRGADAHLARGEFREHAALRSADLLQVRLRCGALKGCARLDLLSYRGVFEDQGIFCQTAARLGERCGDQQ